jgi:glycosyltransferase involved in cell wall biosynthesis
MRICFIAPLLGFSGFNRAAKHLLQGLHQAGADLVVRNLQYDVPDPGTEFIPPQWMQTLMERPLEGIDVVIQCTTANVEAEPKPGLLNVLYSFFEYDRIPPMWANKINQFHCVIVPCVANAQALQRSGVQIPILVMPTPTDISLYNRIYEPYSVAGVEGRTVFYNICQLTAKKGIDLLLRSYFAAFADRPDEVLLVLKTYMGMQNRQNERAQITNFINTIKNGCNMPLQKWPPVHLISSVTTDEDIQRIHANGWIYVNPSRAEGFGYPPFDSLAHGNLLITSAVGGMAQYVSQDNSLVINAITQNVYGMNGHDPYLCNGTARWFEPSTAEMTETMRAVHLLRMGDQRNELSFEHLDQWAQIKKRAENGRAVVGRHDLTQIGPRLLTQLGVAHKSLKERGAVYFDGEKQDA